MADFCLIPIGTPTASVSSEVAAVQRLLKKSGVKYSMHSAGTTLGTLRFTPTIPIIPLLNPHPPIKLLHTPPTNNTPAKQKAPGSK